MSRQSYDADRTARTLDRGPPGSRAAVYTVGQIGPKRKVRPDGSLLCEDVPLARCGEMMYRTDEGIPVLPPTTPGCAQVLYITRDRMSLFAPAALGSAIGAAVTNDHPPVDVDPVNWNQLAKGFVLDAWQGTGDDSDVMFGDIVISDKGLIHKVNSGEIREVSLGYQAAYEDLGNGRGKQHNIIINHLALVERGRCGPRCSIGDRQTIDEEEPTMPRPNIEGTGGARPRNRLDDIRSALEDLETQEQDGVHVHVHMPTAAAPTARTTDAADDDPTDSPLEARVASMEDGMLEMRGMLQTLVTASAARTTDAAAQQQQQQTQGDSAALQTSFQAMLASAEILVPGFRVPTFDSALPRAKTVDSMCATRRSVLTQLSNTTDGAALLGQVCDEGFDVAQSDCASVSTVFKAAASLKAGLNNRGNTQDRLSVPGGAAALIVAPAGGMKPLSGDDINKMNSEYWAKQA